MPFLKSDQSTGGSGAVRTANESKNDTLDQEAGQGSVHQTPTLQSLRAAANREERSPAAEPRQRIGSGQYPLNIPPGISTISQDHFSPNDATDVRRVSDSSEMTLYDRTEEEMLHSLKTVSLSSYQHPNDIASPPSVYISGGPPPSSVKRRPGHGLSLVNSDDQSHVGKGDTSPNDDVGIETALHRGLVSNLLELSRVSHPSPRWDPYPSPSRSLSDAGPEMRPRLPHLYSLGGYDADDPRITGVTRELLDDPADVERNVRDQMRLRSMSYKQRREEAQKIKIRFFVTCTF